MTRFDECLPLVLVHEGGYVNHPKDPGGATNKGITQRTYDAWCKRQGYHTPALSTSRMRKWRRSTKRSIGTK